MEKLIKEKREEIRKIILNSKYSLRIEDFATLVWERLEEQYPDETKNIDPYKAIKALGFEVSDLICEDKLSQYDWIPVDCGYAATYKVTQIQIG